MVLLVDFSGFPPLRHEGGETVQGSRLQSFGVSSDEPAGVLPLLCHGAPR